eukprot:CAMPEP_0202807626 /NCGR_PEP_ID=MMETSP1389-20130828/305_1 /ASSEMBLY_ACC=CAM_ASM_000865 /TAXON_ID=302021 /ORGANISM="Rhodomonas sp., Strain CCMP768" /LENGTH=404 /DNA_ID=CAMNT_0049477687 /DNA_START=8 /DNA_END=1222 /DNA_ORIENTATION=+
MSYGAVSPAMPALDTPSKRRNIIAMALLCAVAATMVVVAFHVSEKPVELAPANAAGLMEEGSIQLDPDSDNPAADFYANSESGLGSDEDVEDAGPGGHLDGWTHPELLEPPAPEDLQSFVSDDVAGPVFNPIDYQRSPGAVQGVLSARNSIQQIQEQLSHAHEEAEAAKDKYEEEEHKSNALKQEYAQYMQKMQQAQAMRAAMMRRGMMMGGPQGQGKGVWASAEQVQAAQAEMQRVTAERAAAQQQQEAQELEEGADESAAQSQESAADAAPLQNLRQTFTAPTQGGGGHLVREEMAIREANEEAALNSDLARLRIARRNLAAHQRHPARAFRGAGVVEGCPEGTPGCIAAPSSSSSSSLRPARNQIQDPQEALVRTAGDDMVPVGAARSQGPSGVVRDLFYQ